MSRNLHTDQLAVKQYGEIEGNAPMHVVGVCKETNTKRMNRRIAPTLVEETTSSVQVLEVGLILLTAEEVHVTNLKVGPEVAC